MCCAMAVAVGVSGCFGVAGILALHCEPKISALFGHASHMRARGAPWLFPNGKNLRSGGRGRISWAW